MYPRTVTSQDMSQQTLNDLHILVSPDASCSHFKHYVHANHIVAQD